MVKDHLDKKGNNLMKRFIASGAAALLLAGGLATASALPASAHTPSYNVDCTGIELNLTQYADIVPGVDPTETTYKTIDNPDYVPAVEAVYVTEAEFVFKNENNPNSPRWEVEGWNADSNPESVGWTATGQTRQTLVTEGSPAIGEPTIQVVDVEGTEGAPEKANTVVVTIDGSTVEDTTFGSTFEADYPFADETVAHDYTIEVVAWDDPQFNLSVAATSEPCGPAPIVPSVCAAPTVLPVSTNLHPQGWEITNGEYVEGGVEFTSSNWSEAYAYHASDFKLSDAANLQVDGATAIIMTMAGGGNVHFEPEPYTMDLWTNTAGVLPVSPGGQGGTYAGNLSDLQSDPTIDGVYLYFASGSAEPVTSLLTSASFNCSVQAFDHEEAVVVPEQPEPKVTVTTDSTVDCDAKTVTTVTTTTTIGTAYDAETNSWIETEPTVQVDTVTRDATEAECPTPAPTEPPTDEPTDTPDDQQPQLPMGGDDGQYLAFTGTNGSGSVGWAGLIALLLGGGMLAGAGIRRRYAQR